MPDDLDTPSLRRFARDLRRIREERDVSLAVIQEETQVQASHLESFESGTLHEEERMNEVYLKAFVRAYAEAIGLPPETVVSHLESAISGAYDDQLAAEFLDVPSREADSGDSETTKDDPAPERGTDEVDQSSSTEETSEDAEDAADESSRRTGDEPPPAASSTTSPQFQPDDSEARGVDESSTGDDPEATKEETFGSEHFSDVTGGPQADDSTPSPPSRSSSSSRPLSSGASLPERVGGFLWAHRMILSIVGVVLLLAVGGVWGGFLVGDDPSPESTLESEPAEKASASDDRSSTTEAAMDTIGTESRSAQPPPANVVLGDTLHVTVRATSDVRELRVQQDDNLRRPYWIEDGEARVFPFTERITLQNQLDSLQLLLEGYPYPTDRTDDQDRIVIRRDTVDQFADTLRGSPVSVSETPDTIWGDGPAGVSDTLSSEP